MKKENTTFRQKKRQNRSLSLKEMELISINVKKLEYRIGMSS